MNLKAVDAKSSYFHMELVTDKSAKNYFKTHRAISKSEQRDKQDLK